jgi:YesN/AraC family two-component response regulator
VSARPKRLQVLVVEDNPLVREFIVDALQDAADVIEARDPEEALARLAERGTTVHLVIVDCVLPSRVDPRHAGIRLVETIRARWPWIWTVGITGALNADELIIQAFRSGVQDFLKKPFALEDLEAALARVDPRVQTRRPGDRPQPDAAIERVIAFIGEHYGERLSLSEVAGLAAMSRWHFCRMFRAATGQSFGHYVRELRLARAKELLTTTGLSLTEVALEVGFYDLPHFDKVFRRRFGISPTEFLRRGPPARGTGQPPDGENGEAATG